MVSIPAGTVAASCAVLLSLAGVSLLLWRRDAVAGTTLFAPWLWTIAAFVMIAAVEIAAVFCGPEWSSLPTLRFMAAALTLCPGVALLGAKRPQEGMWQLAIAAFVAMFWTPAVMQLVLHPGQAVELPTAMAWLLSGLVLFLVANHLLTRFWPSALLAGIGISLLLARVWPLAPQDWGAGGMLAGLACLAAAVLLAACNLPPPEQSSEVDRRWLDFRDAYGAVWALRIAERVNEAAVQNGWRVRLEWGGFDEVHDNSADERAIADADRISAGRLLRSLLRRFT